MVFGGGPTAGSIRYCTMLREAPLERSDHVERLLWREPRRLHCIETSYFIRSSIEHTVTKHGRRGRRVVRNNLTMEFMASMVVFHFVLLLLFMQCSQITVGSLPSCIWFSFNHGNRLMIKRSISSCDIFHVCTCTAFTIFWSRTLSLSVLHFLSNYWTVYQTFTPVYFFLTLWGSIPEQ